MTKRATTKKVPKRKTSLAIDRELWAKLRIQAITEHRPAYEILNEVIAGYLQRKGGRA